MLKFAKCNSLCFEYSFLNIGSFSKESKMSQKSLLRNPLKKFIDMPQAKLSVNVLQRH